MAEGGRVELPTTRAANRRGEEQVALLMGGLNLKTTLLSICAEHRSAGQRGAIAAQSRVAGAGAAITHPPQLFSSVTYTMTADLHIGVSYEYRRVPIKKIIATPSKNKRSEANMRFIGNFKQNEFEFGNNLNDIVQNLC